MKVALLGGSFNPVHNGHVQIAENLLNQKVVDEVWMIPCGNHAFNKDLASGENRLEMLELATKENKKIKVLDLEIKNSEKSYSANTIRFLKENFTYEFYWVIGADNIKDLPRWYDFEYLRNNIKFIVITRPGYSLEKTDMKVVKIVELQSAVSSTKIREKIKQGLPLAGLVAPEVEIFIKQVGLYKQC